MTKKNSRTKNTIYNFISSVFGQFLTIIMQFIVRTIFIRTLGKSYLGINGLFTNILSMLSLAELGFGSAIIFKLYKPVAEKDEHRIAVLMKFYKKVYTIIGIIVLIIGLSLIPFLPVFIKNYEKLESLNINVVFIFILYLLQSVSSYLFFAYKSAIIKVNQKEYILNIVKYAFTIISSLLQILFLYLFKSFELYVVVLVVDVILENIVFAIIANKMYPYINEKNDDKISKEEIKGIFKDCSALFLYKINEVVVKSTDNIVLSMFLGLEMVGLYSNYYVFYTTVRTVFNKIFNSVAHSLGNLHTTNNIEHEYKIYKTINLISVILGGTAFVGVFCVADDFIKVWIGKSWVIPQPFALLMGLELYAMALRRVLGKYRSTMGLFQQAKYRPLFGMIINLVVSVLLVNTWGICGVLAGTLVAGLTTYMWFDPLIIHKYGFKNKYSISKYYIRTIKSFLIVLGIALFDYVICHNFITNAGWLTIMLHSIICGISVPTIIIIIYAKTEEGQHIIKLMKKVLKKAKKI